VSTFLQDLRYAVRVLLKSPAYTAIAVITLALGIGANTTIFSWIDSTLLNPVPGLATPSEVVALSEGTSIQNPFPFSYPDYVALRDGQRSFSGLTAFSIQAMSLTGTAQPQRVWGMVASANYFDVLGVRPKLGRGFLPEEGEKPDGAPVAVISYRLWQTHFGGDPNVIGRVMEINRHPYTIVGVTPAIFQGSATGLRSDLWVPLMMQSQVMPQGDLLNSHVYYWLNLLGRLKPGVTAAQAQAEMTARIKAVAKDYPQEHKGHDTVSVAALWRAPFSANQFFSLLLPMLMAIAGVVLLLACANVANLMLVRSITRRREIAIRMSLGASRFRLVRQLLIESTVLALAGGAIAIAVTLWTAGGMARMIPKMDFPVALNTHVDQGVLVAALAISVATGLIFGILPALRASGEAPVNVLKEDGGSSSGTRGKARLANGLVVAQVALSLLLLICAGLFIRSFRRAQQIAPGFNPRGVLLTSFDLFQTGYTPQNGVEFDRQMIARLQALPGVESVALSNRVPLTLGGGSTSVIPEGYVQQANESMEVQDAIVSPGFLKMIQNPLVSGREFTADDTLKTQRVCLVNEYFAQRYWPNQEPLGKHVHSDLTNEWFTVVGVVRNSKVNNLNEAPTPFIYLPLYQVYNAAMVIYARVPGNPLEYEASVARTIHEMNPDMVLYDVTTLQNREQLASFIQRLAGTFVGAFGLLSLVLAAVGIYGVTSYTTRQRTREIGIRMALGATREDVLRLVLGRTLRLTLTGVALGLLAAFGLTRFLSSQLLGVTSTDALTFSSVALLLCMVTLAACYIPARRAMRVDPTTALRHE
jgi:putative ABC transport system permease protein